MWAEVLVSCLVFIQFFLRPFSLVWDLWKQEKKKKKKKTFTVQSTDVRKYLLHERTDRGGSWLVQRLSDVGRCTQYSPIAFHPTTVPDFIPCDLGRPSTETHRWRRRSLKAAGLAESVSSQPEQVA